MRGMSSAMGKPVSRRDSLLGLAGLSGGAAAATIPSGTGGSGAIGGAGDGRGNSTSAMSAMSALAAAAKLLPGGGEGVANPVLATSMLLQLQQYHSNANSGSSPGTSNLLHSHHSIGHRAQHIPPVGEYTCACTRGWTGPSCEISKYDYKYVRIGKLKRTPWSLDRRLGDRCACTRCCAVQHCFDLCFIYLFVRTLPAIFVVVSCLYIAAVVVAKASYFPPIKLHLLVALTSTIALQAIGRRICGCAW